MASMTLQGKITAPRCTACGAQLSVLTSACGSCNHPFSAAEMMATAGGLLEAGMPRRSIRRQIAEAAAGRAPEIMQAASRNFPTASQGTRLAYLMAVQDFGDPRVIPPALLLRKYEYCAPAVQAEIVLSLGRSDSEEADAAMEKLRGKGADPRVLKAFDDPFFRSEVLSLKGPDPEEEPDEVEEDEEQAPASTEAQWDDDDAPEIEQVEEGEMEEPSKDSVPPPDLRLRADTGEGFEPVRVVKESVPPPIPQPPSIPEPSARVAEPMEPMVRRSPTLPRLPAQDLDVSAGGPEGGRTGPRTARTFIILLLLMLLLGVVTIWQVARLGKEKAEKENRPRKPATQPLEPAGASEKAGGPATEELEEVQEEKGVESHILSFEASASSQHRKYPASNVGDGNPATVWQEDKGEKPLKKFLFLAFPDEFTVTRIGIAIGFDDASGKHGDMFPLNNRLKKAEIQFSDEKVMFKEFEDNRNMQYFELSPPHRTRHIKITVLEVYRGSWFYDNAIAEVEIWGHEEPSVSD